MYIRYFWQSFNWQSYKFAKSQLRKIPLVKYFHAVYARPPIQILHSKLFTGGAELVIVTETFDNLVSSILTATPEEVKEKEGATRNIARYATIL